MNVWIFLKEVVCVNRLEVGREGRNFGSRVMGMEFKEYGRVAREERLRVSISMVIITGNLGRRERFFCENLGI